MYIFINYYLPKITLLIFSSSLLPEDNYPDLRDAVRKKILLYLMRAEEIYENKLPKTDNEKFKVIIVFQLFLDLWLNLQ